METYHLPIDINPSDPRLQGAPLLTAVARGDRKKVKILLGDGANVNQCHPTSGDYALQLAATKGDTGMVGILLSYGAVTYKCHPVTGDFIVKSAIVGGSVEIIGSLFQTGSSLINIDSEINALDFAIQLNRESIVDFFLDDPAMKGELEQTQLTAALHRAITHGNKRIISTVLTRGALPDEMAVRLAVRTKNVDILNLLIGDHWETTNPSFGGKTLVGIASECGNTYIVRKLFKAGAEINEATPHGEALEMLANRQMHKEILGFIRERVTGK